MNSIKEDLLILVDDQDRPWGKLEKSLVHQLGLLHRAFSVFIFNSKGQLLLQQRAYEKYHSGGLWTNTCCSHPRYGEEIKEAIERRLAEEMGLRCSTGYGFSFQYKAMLDNQQIEHEFDHVYFGISDELPVHDPSEVQAWKYEDLDFIEHDLQMNPKHYTAWFRICFKEVKGWQQKNKKENTISHASV